MCYVYTTFLVPCSMFSRVCEGNERHHTCSTMVLRFNSLLRVVRVRRRTKVAAAVKLLAKGADRHLRDQEGRTAMDWAERFGSTRLLDVLLFDPNNVRSEDTLASCGFVWVLSRITFCLLQLSDRG